MSWVLNDINPPGYAVFPLKLCKKQPFGKKNLEKSLRIPGGVVGSDISHLVCAPLELLMIGGFPLHNEE